LHGLLTFFKQRIFLRFLGFGFEPESNLLELARGLVRELFESSFSISFSQAADWRRFHDLQNNVAFCQSAAREKKIEKEFGNNSRTSPLASSKRLDSERSCNNYGNKIVHCADNCFITLYRVVQRFRDKCFIRKFNDNTLFQAFNFTVEQFCQPK
jgi:hypothetical protein